MSESVVVAAVTGVLALAGTTTTALLSQRAQHPDAVRRDAADPGGLRGLLEDERRAHREDRDRYRHALQHIRALLAFVARERGTLPDDLPAPPPDVAGDL